ncbi:MAG: hypothetical protein FJZ87_07050 [Chloroflexi bacterium]|nr:hypothetical protein [Chloroflexota bacterium]
MSTKNRIKLNTWRWSTWIVCLVLIISACSGPAPTATNMPATAPQPPQFELKVNANEIEIPDGIPSGLVKLTSVNEDQDWHTTVIRRLNDDVKLEDFKAAFKENPRSTLPMTSFLGGPDIPAGKSLAGFYTLTRGTYIVVDNWNEPWHYSTFQVLGDSNTIGLPEASVAIEMKEYAISLPKSIPAGKNLWQFTNTGQALHNAVIFSLKPGRTTDDVIKFIKGETVEPPADYLAAWNMLTPGATSWGEIDLQPGDYLVADIIPDFAAGDGFNIEKNMYTTFTVTSTSQ